VYIHVYSEERRGRIEQPIIPSLTQKGYSSMALLLPGNSSLHSTSSSRIKIVLTAYVVLVWFLLVLSGSVLGIFARYPLVYYMTVGGPIVLFLAGYLFSHAFRGFVYALV
jgi:hypothetical protein